MGVLHSQEERYNFTAMKNQTPIPAFLRHLPVYRGYPVPYFIPQDDDGKFLFKYGSWSKMETCIKHHHCCVCFRKLTKKDYWFVSGPSGLQNRCDGHSPMHKRCAEYSMNVCPHLFFEKTKRTTSENEGSDIQIRNKPSTFYLVGAKKFNRAFYENQPLIQFSSIFSTTEFQYRDGELVEM